MLGDRVRPCGQIAVSTGTNGNAARTERVEPHPAGTSAYSRRVKGLANARLEGTRRRPHPVRRPATRARPRILEDPALTGDRSTRSDDRATLPQREEKKRSIVSMGSLVRASLIHTLAVLSHILFFFFLLVRHRAPTLLGLFRHSHAHSHSYTYTHTFSLFLPVHSLLLSLSFSPCRSRSLPLARSCRLVTNSCTCPGGLLERRCLSSSRF